jgi:hypothetical protein
MTAISMMHTARGFIVAADRGRGCSDPPAPISFSTDIAQRVFSFRGGKDVSQCQQPAPEA